MKTILYMAQSVNGYIARENGDTSWIGAEDKKEFKQHTMRAGNAIMGRNTYEAMEASGDFPLPGRLNVVMTREIRQADSPDVVFTDKSPAEVLDMLRERGTSEAVVIGGSKIAKSFLEQGLVDELFITVEPLIFGRGIPFMERGEFVEAGDVAVRLVLLESKKITENEIQLHYAVDRKGFGKMQAGRGNF